MSIKQGGKTIAGATQYHPDLFDFKWADHILDDAQWLMANPFSWQYGSMYQAAYANLSAAIAGKTLQSETVAGITVQFYLADDGHKICPDSEEDKVLSIYNKTGNAWYYIIDTTNQRFKLPRRHSQQIVRSVKNADGSWYRLYADGWVEQGGKITVGESPTTTTHNISLPIRMLDTDYVLIVKGMTDDTSSNAVSIQYGNAYYGAVWNSGKTTTGFAYRTRVGGSWQVSGQSAIDMSSFQDGEKYLYFYVGAFTQTAIENTAGLNAELFNGKADVSTVAHVVTEFQEPTAANNYTWYRKYADGWVEQGGQTSGGGEAVTVTLPIVMADANYGGFVSYLVAVNSAEWTSYTNGFTSRTTTTIRYYSKNSKARYWQVSGMAA